MMRRHYPIFIAVIAVLGVFLLFNSFFIVRQTETALVTQFGNPVAKVVAPGLKFKIPFIQVVEYFDKRLLEYSMPQEVEINSSDEKRIRLAAFVRWRIVDPLAFARATRSSGIGGNRVSTMNTQIANLLNSSLGQAIGRVPMNTLLSPDRYKVMQEIRDLMTKQTMNTPEPVAVEKTDKEVTVPDAAKLAEAPKATEVPKGGYGIEIVDVRIVKADLPPENSMAVFRRMQTEREREAKGHRAKGDEESQRIKATADRDRTVLLAEAQKKAETIRGEGDGLASKIFASAFGKDPEFFEFYRTLQTYQRTLSSKDTTIILSPDSQFMKQFSRPNAQ
jgi:modulator of FtsH protease HflC